MSEPLFEFKLRAVAKDPSGYYYPKWEEAEKITVTSENKDKAIKKAMVALGKTERGWPWAFTVDDIQEVT